MAEKEKYQLEYTINASPKVLYNRLSNPAGLSEWFADDVNINNKIYTFIWNGDEQDAELIGKRDLKYVRFKWTDEDDDSFFEFKITVDDLTGDVALNIIDFAEEDEKEDAINLWDNQVNELKHILGS